MCNVYQPAQMELFTELPPGKKIRKHRPFKPIVGPLNDAPYYTPDGWVVGQWGMIPPDSKTHIPMTREGRRLSTNNARIEGIEKKWTFRFAWAKGQRCLIPALSYDEPNWESGRNVWWTFTRKDEKPWMLGGLYSEWVDKETGEVWPNFTMLTQNCNAHSLLNRMHKPELDPKTKEPLPLAQQDKRAVVPIEEEDWDRWLNGSIEDALALVKLPSLDVIQGRPRA